MRATIIHLRREPAVNLRYNCFPSFPALPSIALSTSTLSSCHVVRYPGLSGPSYPESSRPILRGRNNHLYSRRDSCGVAILGEEADENQIMVDDWIVAVALVYHHEEVHRLECSQGADFPIS